MTPSAILESALYVTDLDAAEAFYAEILGLSEHTVNHYLNQVTRKLEAVNRTQAVVKAIRRGLIA